MKNSDMPAMPSQWKDFDSMGIEVTRESYHGLTKREYFAAKAMQAIVSSQYYADFCNESGGVDRDYSAAIMSVNHADALLKALEE